MTVDEAITELENYPPFACPDKSIKLNQAIQLRIEALKAIRSDRLVGRADAITWLIGER